MDKEAAEELAGVWVRVQSACYDEVVDYYQWLAQEVAALCSSEAEAGVAEVNGTWAIVALDGQRLLSFSVPEADSAEEGSVEIRCQTVALDGSVDISLSESIKPEARGLVRRRHWSFLPRGGEPMLVSTEQLLRAAFQSDETAAEAEHVARNAARQAGWPVPADDAAESG